MTATLDFVYTREAKIGLSGPLALATVLVLVPPPSWIALRSLFLTKYLTKINDKKNIKTKSQRSSV